MFGPFDEIITEFECIFNGTIPPIKPRKKGLKYIHFPSYVRVPFLTLRRLMSYIYIYIYGAPILDVSRSHTTTHHSR